MLKRLIAVLMILCLMLGFSTVAMAAKPVITQQPETMTVKKGGTVSFTIKAKNANSITWHFINPMTGQDLTGKQLSKSIPGVKVVSPNGKKITLKKVPEAMHGWSVYCHLGQKNSGVDSDTVMLLIDGKELPEATPVPTKAVSASAADDSRKSSETESSSSIVAVSTVTASPTPSPTPKPEKIVITGNSKIDLFAVDSKGEPTGKSVQELTFNEPAASFYVKIPDATEGTISYVSLDSVRLTPDGETRGMTVRGWPTSASVKIKVKKPGSESEEDTSKALVLPEETEEPVDPSTLVTVKCENCRFTGYHSSFAGSGEVPVGSTITVIASGGMVGKGYFINGAKKAVHKNEASFQYVVEGDTVIVMEKQK